MFKKVLVANRGEIAVRVIRACRELGIGTVAVYSDVDREGLAVRMADEAYPLGDPRPSESYLNAEKLLAVYQQAGCDGLHPGYGFLSENPAFVEQLEAAGATFIGPGSQAIRCMGDKLEARRTALELGVPVIGGSAEPASTESGLRAQAAEVGFPLMLKAAAGGGGKGIRIVRHPDQLVSAWQRAASEATTAFGNGAMYVERYLEQARHIEIQILADGQRAIHLGERECSLQRRHQKVLEEAPSVLVTPELRAAMGEAACRLATGIGYSNAGTVEFLVEETDAGPRFYFLEMNTRLQVEHPVTEMITGLDLVQAQLRLAAGEPLWLKQEEIVWQGWAVEARITAEDPASGFMPRSGRVEALELPAGPFVRFDGALYAGLEVSLEYDPLLGKLIAWAPTREEALCRLGRALDELLVAGVPTSAPFLRRLLQDPEVMAGQIHTRWLEDRLASAGKSAAPPATARLARVAAALTQHLKSIQPEPAPAAGGVDRWVLAGRMRAQRGRGL